MTSDNEIAQMRGMMFQAWHTLQSAESAYTRARDEWRDARKAQSQEKASEEEKGSESVGPHTHARNTKGHACLVHEPTPQHRCKWCQPATHHATQPTQVLGNTARDATSHG